MNTSLKNSVIYQIYPTSFYDSNGDGIGDLEGIHQKLDYLEDLGVDVLWISPIYKSPFRDGGYDVADFRKVDPKFGSIADFKRLAKDAHAHGIRILLDFTIGHTSIDCKWFKQSQKIEKNKYTDYYIWTDSVFDYEGKMLSGMSERDANVVVNYYSHQPALNYGYGQADPSAPWKLVYTDERLRPLREEIISILCFWLNNGADGFRMDLANLLVKQTQDVAIIEWIWSKLIGGVKNQYPNAIFLAEWGEVSSSVGKCGFDADYLNHINLSYNAILRNEKGLNVMRWMEKGKNYFSTEGLGDVAPFINDMNTIESDIKGKGYCCIPTGYHDVPRVSMRKSMSQLKVIFAFLMTYQNLPLIYYGDEIGIAYNTNVSRDGGYVRTGARTPMQWDGTLNNGFSVNPLPYLPTGNENEVSVSVQEQDEKSLLNMVKQLIKLRRTTKELSSDSPITIVECENGGYPLIYSRGDKNSAITIFINPSNQIFKRKFLYKDILASSNTSFTNNRIVLNAESFAIVR